MGEWMGEWGDEWGRVWHVNFFILKNTTVTAANRRD